MGALSPALREAAALARTAGASDLHLLPGAVPAIRVDGAVRRTPAAELHAADLAAAIEDLLPAYALAAFERDGAASAALHDAVAGPLRAHAYRTSDGPAVAIRLLPASVPAWNALGLPRAAVELSEAASGLAIFCGPTGSGKTTSLASLVDRMNRSVARVVVTIEDPIEYRHRSERCAIVQREIGSDVASFEDGLLSALRSDPDVIVLGELRARETMQSALRAAETGHLVLATMHAPDATRAIARIVEAFPAERQSAVRSELADVLAGVVAQRLIPREGGGRSCAAEVLVATDAVRGIVRDGKLHQLRNAIALGRASGMQHLEDDVRRLLERGEIRPAMAAAHASSIASAT